MENTQDLTKKLIQSEDSNSVKQAQEENNQNNAVITASGATIAATAVVTDLVASTQTKPFDRSLWNPLLTQTNKPLNQIPIVNAHNVATYQGSGTTFIADNQTMSTQDILANTPVGQLGGIEFKVDSYQGQIVVNHGDIHDPTVSNPVTMQSQLDIVKKWVQDPANSDSLIILHIGNDTNNATTKAAINQAISQTFGSELYSSSQFYGDINSKKFLNMDGTSRWPTAAELTSKGKHVIIISEGMNNDLGATIGASDIMNNHWYSNNSNSSYNSIPSSMFWNSYGEDRTLVGDLGSGVNSEIMGRIDTAQMDQLVAKGGLISLDQLSPNDPRLIAPDQRDKLALDPDVSLFGGVLHVNRGLASSLTFGAGVSTDVGSGSFAIVDGISKAYNNFKFINQVEQHLTSLIDIIDEADLKLFKQKNKTLNQPISKQDVIDYCHSKLSSTISKNALMAGGLTTTSLATSIFSAGLLFPIAFPITSIIAIATLAIGATATLIGNLINKKKLDQKLKKVFASKNFDELVANKINDLAEASVLESSTDNKSRDNLLSKISGSLLISNLALRISSMAKYAVTMVGTVASSLIGFALMIRTAIDSVINYQNRQKYIDDLPSLLTKATLPNINAKKYIFFGKTPLDNYLFKNQNELVKQYDLPENFKNLKLKEFKNILAKEFPVELNQIKQQCQNELIKDDLTKFCKQHSITYNMSDESITKLYVIDKVDKFISRDVISSGIFNSAKIAAGIATLGSMLFAPFAAIFVGLGAVGFGIGSVITNIVAKGESNKFTKASNDLLFNEKNGHKHLKAQAILTKINNAMTQSATEETLSNSTQLKESNKQSQQQKIIKLANKFKLDKSQFNKLATDAENSTLMAPNLPVSLASTNKKTLEK